MRLLKVYGCKCYQGSSSSSGLLSCYFVSVSMMQLSQTIICSHILYRQLLVTSLLKIDTDSSRPWLWAKFCYTTDDYKRLQFDQQNLNLLQLEQTKLTSRWKRSALWLYTTKCLYHGVTSNFHQTEPRIIPQKLIGALLYSLTKIRKLILR